MTIENTDSDLKVHALHYANELLVRVRLSFQKLLQNRSTCRNNTKCLEKSNDAYSFSISVQTTINHILIFTFLCFIRQYQRQRKCFLSERELKKTLRDTLTRAAWFGFDWFVLSMGMQVSSFARPGSAPIWGGKKGEFRDWTNSHWKLAWQIAAYVRVRSYVVYGVYKLRWFKNRKEKKNSSENYFLTNLVAQAVEFRSCKGSDISRQRKHLKLLCNWYEHFC